MASTGVAVLASPKAKLAAKEMGFDLAELRNAELKAILLTWPVYPKVELFVYLFAGFG